ncbi:hypothetical protein PQD71_gp188 [Kosakonia phage Kc263]|uniref:Uncharacterized protein n=1 Tax=Kosakonia phage Kc263 TaxID=2863194 RepID=A0AAE8BFJ1_9CAUD|nr:hypothetical protein PQD71_gp188 [Kosakonia phage Kc263]QYN80138.1 hypothetical protein [Kosakonia phage Kc263]
MIIKRLAAAKGEGRKKFFGCDNLLATIFMIGVLSFALAQGYYIFAYFSMGLIVARTGEIIFEIKKDLFDRPFIHVLILIGVPGQYIWNLVS